MTAILDRVLADLVSSELDDDVSDVILAACLGDADLGALLGGTRPVQPPATPPQGDAVGAYLKSITVSGFRGIGPQARLGLQPGPGLTLIVGRNGSGKSSFAEAAEFVFTGGSSRWKARSAIWAAGWRNLHKADPASLQVEITQDAVAGSTVVGTRWASGAALDDADRYVKRPGAPEADFGSLGWDSALEVYRPFLSYAELGNAVTGNPSGLFDALHSILGLQVVQDALTRTTRVRLDHSASARQFKADTTRMIERAESADDERATVTAAELGKRTPNLVLLADLASGADTPPDGTMNRLRRIAATAFPSIQEVRAVGEELLRATEDMNALQTLAAERALRLAQILELSATEIEAAGGGTCPACGVTELTAHWPDEARHAAAALMQEAQSVTAARSRLQAVQARAGQLVMNTPPATDFATDYPAVASLLSEWHEIDPHADPLKAADRILTVGGETAAVSHCRPGRGLRASSGARGHVAASCDRTCRVDCQG